MASKKKLLVVDDDDAIRFAIGQYFEIGGFEVLEAMDCEAASLAAQRDKPDLALVDYRLPDGTALDLLARWRESDLGIPVIVLTGHGSIDLAVRTIKDGAENFVTKPIELDTLKVIVERTLEHEHHRRVERVRRSREARDVLDPFVGTSAAIRRLENEARKVLRGQFPILVQGETGTGKGVLSAWLHKNGPREGEAFVDINCAGLRREFLESELFGHEKGAFTGADKAKAGLLEMANRGTLFLDEIGDLDIEVQPKLLKVLEEKRFRRLGENRDRQVDLWLIAATHQDLRQLAREDRFRRDLYFRLSTIPLTVPPLRERVEDVPLLAETFLVRLGVDLGRGELRLDKDAQRALQTYSWPGNVRELRNVLERAALLCDGAVLSREDLRFQGDLAVESRPAAPEEDLTLRELEVRYIAKMLQDEKGNVPRAADRLGVPRSTLYQKIKRYGIEVTDS